MVPFTTELHTAKWGDGIADQGISPESAVHQTLNTAHYTVHCTVHCAEKGTKLHTGVLATNSNNADQGRSLAAGNSIMGGAARSSYDTWLLECRIFVRQKSGGYEIS